MIVPQEIYHPLYEDKEKFIIFITGGRGSGSLSMLLLLLSG